MDAKTFSAWLGQVGSLSSEQRTSLQRVLTAPSAEASATALLDRRPLAEVECPHCHHKDVQRWGAADGLQRYRCQGCKRTFNALTGTGLARLRYKSRWLEHSAALEEGVSVRKAADRLNVAVSTAFRWRHRFLTAPKIDQPTDLKGIVEADETFFRRSLKGSRVWSKPQPGKPAPKRAPRKRGKPTGRRGTPLDEQVPVLIIRDRQHATSDAVLADLTAATIGAALLPRLSPDAVLCTDAGKVYPPIARKAGIRHEPVNIAIGERVRAGAFHIQNVNAYDSRLKGWMHRFNGVATKYLDSYLGWRRMLEALGPTSNPSAVLVRCL
jgi:transposase-like protein